MIINEKLYEKALVVATRAHKSQVRKSNGLPYIFHPIMVMFIVMKVKKSTNMLLLGIVALLHDVYEDCPGWTLERIAKEFGLKVAALVEELSSDPKELARLGKREYLSRKMIGMSSYALVIKLADRFHNTSDLKEMKESFRNNYIDETNYILANLLASDRKLTTSHKKLIRMIKKNLSAT